MREKDLVEVIKKSSEKVRKLERDTKMALKERRKAFLNAVNDGMTYKEVAKYAGVSEHTVQTDLRLARQTEE